MDSTRCLTYQDSSRVDRTQTSCKPIPPSVLSLRHWDVCSRRTPGLLWPPAECRSSARCGIKLVYPSPRPWQRAKLALRDMGEKEAPGLRLKEKPYFANNCTGGSCLQLSFCKPGEPACISKDRWSGSSLCNAVRSKLSLPLSCLDDDPSSLWPCIESNHKDFLTWLSWLDLT